MLLRGIGIACLEVHRRPRVALLCTGRELVDSPGGALGSGQIYNTNGPFLARRLALAGAEVIINQTIHDDPAVFRAAVLAAQSAGADVVLSTGAVSMGRYDFVPEVLSGLGATLLFHKVRMRPGKPLLAATLPSGVLCIGLPGNPVSCAVGQRFFVEAALRRMLGMPDERPWRLPLATAVSKKLGFSMLQKAALELDGNGQVRVRLLQGQESFRTRPLLEARVWAVLPEDAERVDAGCLVDVLPLGHIDSNFLREA
jgi:molybdopterin molybdotransferase